MAFEARVDADDVTLASFARVDAQVWQLIWIGEDDEPAGVSLAAGDAGHARVHPLVRAPRADEPSLAGDEGFAAVDENAHLRRPAALRAEALLTRDRQGACDLRKRLQHRRRRGARQKHVRPALRFAP